MRTPRQRLLQPRFRSEKAAKGAGWAVPGQATEKAAFSRAGIRLETGWKPACHFSGFWKALARVGCPGRSSHTTARGRELVSPAPIGATGADSRKDGRSCRLRPSTKPAADAPPAGRPRFRGHRGARTRLGEIRSRLHFPRPPAFASGRRPGRSGASACRAGIFGLEAGFGPTRVQRTGRYGRSFGRAAGLSRGCAAPRSRAGGRCRGRRRSRPWRRNR